MTWTIQVCVVTACVFIYHLYLVDESIVQTNNMTIENYNILKNSTMLSYFWEPEHTLIPTYFDTIAYAFCIATYGLILALLFLPCIISIIITMFLEYLFSFLITY